MLRLPAAGAAAAVIGLPAAAHGGTYRPQVTIERTNPVFYCIEE